MQLFFFPPLAFAFMCLSVFHVVLPTHLLLSCFLSRIRTAETSIDVKGQNVLIALLFKSKLVATSWKP